VALFRSWLIARFSGTAAAAAAPAAPVAPVAPVAPAAPVEVEPGNGEAAKARAAAAK
jgi:hypothetical protein